MNYIEIDTINKSKISDDYNEIIDDYEYLKINPRIYNLKWIFFNKERLVQLKKYTYLHSLLCKIGYDKIDNVGFIKLNGHSKFIFNRENTYKKNYRVYEIPIKGGERIDYCNDKKAIYSLEFNKLYLINAEKKLEIFNQSDYNYIYISITVKNKIQHLNLVNNFNNPIIIKFYNCLHPNRKKFLDNPCSSYSLFNYKKLNETCIDKSKNFISINASKNIFGLLNNLKGCKNTHDVYIWIYRGLDINIEVLEENFMDSKFNIYYNIVDIDSYKWGIIFNVYLFKKYYNKVLLIKNEITISHMAIDKIFDIEHVCKIICAYGFNFNDCAHFNNKTIIYNNLVDYASLDFALIPLELISDEFFNWVIDMGKYISRMEYIVNVYSVVKKKYKLVSYKLNIKFNVPIARSKLELNYINNCYTYFIKKYSFPFKHITQKDSEKIEDINNIIIIVVLRNNVCVDNLKICLESIKNQTCNRLKVCIINDSFWGDYDIIDVLIEYIKLKDWYYIDNTFNAGHFLSIHVALELLKVEDNDIIINIEPYLKLLNNNIIQKILDSFRVNNIKILLGNISFSDIPIFDYTLVEWPDNNTKEGFNAFLNREYCNKIINPLLNKKSIYTNPFKYLISFTCKYFRYISQKNFNNNFVIEMLNRSKGHIEIFCKPLSKSLVLDNQRFNIIDYKKGRLNYNKFILKDKLESLCDISFKFSKRKYMYEYIRKKSQSLYIIFVSRSNWNTIKYLIPIFKHINCNIILLRDNNNYFLKGIPNLSNNIDFTIEYIRKMIRRTNSKIVKTYGIHDAGFAAIYYGIIFKVQSIIVKDPYFKIDNKSQSWKDEILRHNITKAFFNLENIRSRVPIKYIITKGKAYKSESLNIEIIKDPHIDLGYFVNEMFSPV